MANPEHVKIVKSGAKIVDAWRKRNPETNLDLTHLDFSFDCFSINFSFADLTGATIRHKDMSYCDFTGANLDRVLFYEVELIGSIFTESSCMFTEFVGANLEEAMFSSTELNGTKFYGCNLKNADFSGCEFVATNLKSCKGENTRLDHVMNFASDFIDLDLREFLGLSTILHLAPSTIGIDTILKSEGEISHEFLSGCGLPDHIIEFVDSIAKKPIQFYSCFISHSSYDEGFAKYLFDHLRGKDVRCWFFPESARTGEKLWDEINKAIRMFDKLVIICSQHSLESKPVLREIEEGLKREQAENVRKLKDEERVVKEEMTQEEFKQQQYHTHVLFPITIDDYIFEGWQHPLKFELQKNRVIGDFRRWQVYAEFDKQFQKLLKDLNSKS